MTTYARTDETGQPVEIIEIGDEAADLYTPEFIAALIPWDPASPLPEYQFPAAPVPFSVTMRQARLALLSQGILDDVETAIAEMDDRAVQIEWEFATTVERQSPFVAQIAELLALDDEALDALFLKAVSL